MKINASIYEVDSMTDDYNLGLAPDINKIRSGVLCVLKGMLLF